MVETMRQERMVCMGNFKTPLCPLEKLGALEDFFDSIQVLESFLGRNDLIDIDL